MKFQVPQFIEVEDKIFGPLTFKQAVYLAGAGGFALATYLLLPFFVFIILSAPVIVLAIALAFIEINRRPFIYTLEAAFKHLTKSKLYTWQRTGSGQNVTYQTKPSGSKDKLRELHLDLETKQNNPSDDSDEAGPHSHRLSKPGKDPESSNQEPKPVKPNQDQTEKQQWHKAPTALQWSQ